MVDAESGKDAEEEEAVVSVFRGVRCVMVVSVCVGKAKRGVRSG